MFVEDKSRMRLGKANYDADMKPVKRTRGGRKFGYGETQMQISPKGKIESKYYLFGEGPTLGWRGQAATSLVIGWEIVGKGASQLTLVVKNPLPMQEM